MLIAAHAKVNLFLAVGCREAGGYHAVTTILQAIDLADAVSVSASDVTHVVCDPDVGVPAEENLACRAAGVWVEASGRRSAAEITIEKRIPHGAGLGGGSSDAAAVLAALSGWSSGRGQNRLLLKAAATLGADVPFFLGPGTQLMSGRGDVPVEVLPTPELDLVLVKPPVPVSTAAAYERFDSLPPADAVSPQAAIEAIKAGDRGGIARALHNDLAEAACSLVPEVASALRFLQTSPGILGATVAGSGSTLFGICGSREDAEASSGAARELGWWSCAARTATAGLELLETDR